MTSSRRRRVLWVPLLSLLSMLGCASLLDVDGYQSSPETLCDLLDRCFEGQGLTACRANVDAALDAAPADVRAKWLADFLDLSCGKQCGGARRCLDLDPLCAGPNANCGLDEDCCGFLTGKAECQAPVGAQPDAKQCCRPLGVNCTDGAACCAGLVCDPDSGTCGGITCKDPGAACRDNAECCTKICRPGPDDTGQCADQVCFDTGFPCSPAAGGDCCEGLICDAGTCRVPQCVPEGVPCEPGNTTKTCCAGTCQAVDTPSATGAKQGVCITGTCFPRNSICDPNGAVPCCEGSNCVKGVNRCGTACASRDDYCVKDDNCCGGLFVEPAVPPVPESAPKPLKCDLSTNTCKTCSQGYCDKAEDCCTGFSCDTVAKVCKKPCAPAPEPNCSHAMTQPGKLLAVKTASGTYTHCANTKQLYIDQQCVETVCEADPSCCCNTWDDLCAIAASACVAQPKCTPFQQKCAHDMGSLGVPLGTEVSAGTYKSCDPSGTNTGVKPKCVEKICTADPTCCCNKWDATCVTEYYFLNSFDLDCQ